jgi:hypothetical protein
MCCAAAGGADHKAENQKYADAGPSGVGDCGEGAAEKATQLR